MLNEPRMILLATYFLLLATLTITVGLRPEEASGRHNDGDKRPWTICRAGEKFLTSFVGRAKDAPP
jgi:hypothetical protein